MPDIINIFINNMSVEMTVIKSPNNYLTHLPPGQNGRHSTDDIFRRIFVNENFRILIKTSLKFVSKGPIENYPAFV